MKDVCRNNLTENLLWKHDILGGGRDNLLSLPIIISNNFGSAMALLPILICGNGNIHE